MGAPVGMPAGVRPRGLVRGLDRGALAGARLALALEKKGAPTSNRLDQAPLVTNLERVQAPTWKRTLITVFNLED